MNPSLPQSTQTSDRVSFEQCLLRSSLRPQPLSLVASVTIHALVVSLALFLPPFDRRVFRKEDYRVLPAPEKKKLIWYRLETRMPEISLGSKSQSTPPKPRHKSNEISIQASVPDAPPAPQLIFQPEVQAETRKNFKLPNMAAFRPPPPPGAKPNPELEMPALPEQKSSVPAPPPSLLPSVAPPKPAPRRFNAPPQQKPAPPRQVELAELPTQVVQTTKALGDLTAVVAGARPAMSDAPLLPDVNRPGSVSVGPSSSRRGAAGGAAGASPVEGLELITKGGAESASALKSSYVTQTIIFTRDVVDQRREAVSVPVRLAMLPPLAQQLFGNRTVYLTFLDKLNPVNYSGEVLMWFAERGQTAQGGQAMHAPVPFRQTDPLAPQSKVGQAIQGTVRLAAVVGKDGFLSAIRLLEGPDDHVNKALLTAAERWTFLPALRGQERIEVDVLIDVPVALKPNTGVQASR